MRERIQRVLNSHRARVGAALSGMVFALWAGASPGWDSVIALIMAAASYLVIEFAHEVEHPEKGEEGGHGAQAKRVMSTPLVVAGCRWDEVGGVWVESRTGNSYCHKCAVGDVKSPMRRVAENEYRCPVCQPAI